MVRITASYQGDLHCLLTHEPSGKTLETDAPKDNQGKGESFSPTDLAASSLLTCSITTMAIYAKRHNKELPPMSGEVIKEMSAEPPRRISRLTIILNMPKGFTVEERASYERVAQSCPVHKSLHPDTQVVTRFVYAD